MTFLRTAAKVVGGGLGVAVGGTAGVVAYKYNTDPGVKRTLHFTYEIMPLAVAYGKAVSKDYPTPADKDAALQDLHQVWAPEALRIVLDMKGYYIKAAQMMCGVGMLPDVYEDVLKVLLDDVPARDTSLIKSIIESELGAPVEQVFDSFRDTPIGCASIGQVHLATLKGSGQKVVVKVQYPEVEGFFQLDLLTIKMICGSTLSRAARRGGTMHRRQRAPPPPPPHGGCRRASSRSLVSPPPVLTPPCPLPTGLPASCGGAPPPQRSSRWTRTRCLTKWANHL
jgi:hypothetical protein